VQDAARLVLLHPSSLCQQRILLQVRTTTTSARLKIYLNNIILCSAGERLEYKAPERKRMLHLIMYNKGTTL
jgi:hypothetical protein